MPTPVPFTDNYQDHSTSNGFSFEFFCERCGNGYKSAFVANKLSMATKGLRTLGGLLGGRVGNAGWASGELQDMTESQAKDKALQAAVQEIAPLFNQCHRCGQWVCKEICWNTEFNMCVNDAPKLEGEIATAQSDARLQQVRQQTQSVNWTKGLDLETSQKAQCPHCGAEVSPSSKFCGECGQAISANLTCGKCGTESEAGTKFCPECGNKLA